MMNVSQLKVDRHQARETYRKYLSHKNGQSAIDREIQQVYYLLARGKLIINARESILQAGFDAQGLPKLGLARADSVECALDIWTSGMARFRDNSWKWTTRGAKPTAFEFPDGSFPKRERHWQGVALLPHIPPEHRPKRGIQNYHLLWEANWQKKPPVDPMLLRRIHRTDFWLVLAAWDLTEVERAVLAAHVR